MSAVLSSGNENPVGISKPCTIDNREGDWKAYLQSMKNADEKTICEAFGSIIAYQRACALAYLGRRAQLRGGVCSTTHPHIMTQRLIANLEASNKAERYARYPWLEAWTNILGEIERIQDEISTSSNVVPILPNTK